ncbi:ExeM/NucH family extracellular endonuclease [Janthinobacterium agaricidamnosum]|uniref:Endonuclease/Exonuclease/phosphatase family protein n=1 Tax=Janthinobacterium agaricidamnosum NBRC 102515 = DSM 9628 TaxID=1349767 RepID=W0VAH4_9BURK|nr:ExeM/NucH family extracellular endonuclease [Janthinobacterium agaricidamnosum]CDG84590.1 endonuclease/Exonuclease/phosphatase family protein [Janthinobacterium agaricidamnosum NBRC 102515 = DSM 9628]
MKTFSSPRSGVAASPLRLTVIAALMAAACGPALAASDVVISQVYGGGGNTGALYKNDFIEIFNRGPLPVDVSNWSVQYSSATGSTWQVTALPNRILQAGQYLLVQQAKGAGGTDDLPAPDAIGAIAMSGTTGKVALSNGKTALSGANPSGAALLDLVGFGTAGGFEGSVAPAPSNTSAILRAGNGCIDSDDNGADFSTGPAAPRNSASPLHACGAAVAHPIIAVCPASLALALGSGGTAALSASDVDGIVNGAAITSPAVAGISLANFVAAGVAGDSASVSLTVAANVAAGNYPVRVNFTNDQAQSKSCQVDVSVQGLSGISHTIPQIQGNGPASPYANQVHTTEGVLTLKVGTGFFIQDPSGDGDSSTSDGLFVYTGSTLTSAQPGDLVRVTGTVFEYTPAGSSRSYTELKDVTAILTRSSGHSITPTNIQLPNANLAQFEGMLVRFSQPLTVSQNAFLGSRGELTLSSLRREVPTNRHPAGSPEAVALAATNESGIIVLDDGIFVTPTVIPYIGQDGTVRNGDTVANLTGVVDFGAIGGGGAAYKLQPTLAPVFSRDNPRSAAPSIAPGNVTVASANVLNFFTTFTNGNNVFGQTGQACTLGSSSSKSNCRGADNLNEFNRQRDKIVAELKAIDADVVGLMEIQNNGETAVSYLVEQLNAAIGSVSYAYVPKPASTGTDAIRVAMIYKPSKVGLVGGALTDTDAINNRPPMAQTFRAANGEKFSLIVNHLKSKGSCPSGAGGDADNGDSQGCWNATRVGQAQRLVNSFVPQVVAAANDPDVLIIGDLNSYGAEDPINAIVSAGFVNQLERYVRPDGMPYSFVFGGLSGYLDHALASAALSPQVSGASEWHINADEPQVIDYNTDNKPQDLYNALPYRASDHDPVVISLNLQPAVSDISASVSLLSSGLALNRVTQQYTGTVSLTNRGKQALNGPFQVRFDGLPAGVTLLNANGSNAGAAYLTVNLASLAPGATLSLPVSFSNPSKVAISYGAKIFSGNF